MKPLQICLLLTGISDLRYRVLWKLGCRHWSSPDLRLCMDLLADDVSDVDLLSFTVLLAAVVVSFLLWLVCLFDKLLHPDNKPIAATIANKIVIIFFMQFSFFL